MQYPVLACILCCSLLGSAQAHAASGPARQGPLAHKLAAPSADVMAVFESAGMREVRPHTLSPAELRKVEQALAALPSLHRTVLENRLRHLSFVDGLPGAGSGLTSKVGESSRFDITLRASLLDESLSAFLTNKERRLFAAAASGPTVDVDAPDSGALLYVLLHEASHVVDAALGITTAPDGPFTRGVWIDRSTLAPALADSAAASTPFRRAAPIPATRAVEVYDALGRTPFVSLYATAAAPEDFAELVTWRTLAQRFGGGLRIVVRDASGAQGRRYAPLEFEEVKARMRLVDDLLARARDAAGVRALQRALADGE